MELYNRFLIFAAKTSRMKRIIRSIVIVSCLLVCACNEPGKTPSISGKQHFGHLHVEKSSQSFGIIHKKDILDVVVKFCLENTGNAPITISKIDVSCGCITAKIASKTILPGERQILSVNLNAKNQNGHINKTVFVNSDADNPILLVRVKGNIIE